MSLAKSAFTVGGITMISRLAGFTRDWLMALTLGAGPAADAFFVAFKLPNFFRRLFAEGAFSVAFVPFFAAINGQSPGAGKAFAERVLSIFLPVLLIFVGLMEAVMPWLVMLLTGGFKDGDPEKFALAVHLTRLTFPFLALISLVSLLAGVLNGLRRFAAAASMPVLLNMCLIAAMLLAPTDTRAVATYLAAAVTLSGLLQVLCLLWACRSAGVALRLRRPQLSPNVVRMLKVMLPAAIGAGAVQINLLIDVVLATRFLPEGSISYLYYGDRLSQLPIGVIGVAVGTVLLPELARQLAGGLNREANTTQNRAMELVLVITLPAMAALVAIPETFITVLFEHGAFTAQDSAATALALRAYAVGLPAYVLIKVLTPGFYARGNTKTPVRISITCLCINTALGIALMGPLAHAGLALATAVAGWVNALWLYAALRAQGHLVLEDRLRGRLLRIVLAGLLLGLALYGVIRQLPDIWSGTTLIALPLLLCLVAAGMLFYGLLGSTLGAFKLGELKAALRRKPVSS